MSNQVYEGESLMGLVEARNRLKQIFNDVQLNGKITKKIIIEGMDLLAEIGELPEGADYAEEIRVYSEFFDTQSMLMSIGLLGEV